MFEGLSRRMREGNRSPNTLKPSLVSLKAKSRNNKGLTLIECLVAIVVIGTTTAAIGPMMIFSVATRVQNQKTEQALQLAQGEIDKVRLAVEQGGDYGNKLERLNLVRSTSSFASKAATAASVLPPNAFITLPTPTAFVTNERQARLVDIDGDGTNDFAIQLFRTPGQEVPSQTIGVTTDTPVAFNLGVRVYDARANQATLTATPGSLTFTSGEGQRGQRPLAVIYSHMAQGDRDASLCQYWRYQGGTPTNFQCN